MLPQGQKKEELKYIELHAEYKSRLNSPKTSAKLLIPKHTTLMVWYERWQFNDDFMDYKHMWERGEPTFHIPEGIVRYDRILSNKDVEVVMVLMSKRNEGNIPDSRIIEELNGGSWPVNIDYGSPSYEYEPYGLWVKMYEHPTYIPELGTEIVAYGVMEENLPTVNECFKYGNKKHSRIDGKVVINPLTMKGWGNINSIATHGQERMRLDSNGNISLSWTCNICGMDTSQVEYDYLGSGTNHLQCELKNGMSFMQHMEHMKRSIHLEL